MLVSNTDNNNIFHDVLSSFIIINCLQSSSSYDALLINIVDVQDLPPVCDDQSNNTFDRVYSSNCIVLRANIDSMSAS